MISKLMLTFHYLITNSLIILWEVSRLRMYGNVSLKNGLLPRVLVWPVMKPHVETLYVCSNPPNANPVVLK